MFGFCGEVKMPINNYEDYLSQISLQNEVTFQYNLTQPTSPGRLTLMSRLFPIVPSTPSSSIALDNTSLYAINNRSNPLGTSNFFLLGGQIQSGGLGSLIVVDLLNVSGGLSAILTTEQTTGLPTAPLTRYFSGEGVFAGLITWEAIGSASTTVSINYTYQNGISERTSPLASFSTNIGADRNVARIFLMPLASGDTGVQSVKSVTLSSSTGTAGNFGVILFKPLSMIALNNETVAFDAVSSGRFVGSLSTILPSTCLSGILSPGAGNQAVSGSLFLGE